MAGYRQLILGELGTNCYVVWDENSRETIVVDPPDSAEIIGDYVLQNKLELKLICLTHGHFDHVMAAAELKLNFGTLIGMNMEDEFLWKRQTKTAQHFTGSEFLKLGEMTKIDVDFRGTESFKLGQVTVEIIKLPGHTPGSVGFYMASEGWLFSGDVVFEEGEGTSEYGYGDKDKLKKSIRKIKKLPKETLVLPGHGESFYLATLTQ
jgi:glyoxylase-like metal-dependent hydrolase (beta-lactamase superfamily II)